jgi:hypothetical protein
MRWRSKLGILWGFKGEFLPAAVMAVMVAEAGMLEVIEVSQISIEVRKASHQNKTDSTVCTII